MSHSNIEKVIYANFDDMIREIRRHSRQTGHYFRVQDELMYSRYGFIDNVDKWFMISIINFKKYCENMLESGQNDPSTQIFHTKEGRELFCAIINKNDEE